MKVLSFIGNHLELNHVLIFSTGKFFGLKTEASKKIWIFRVVILLFMSLLYFVN